LTENIRGPSQVVATRRSVDFERMYCIISGVIRMDCRFTGIEAEVILEIEIYPGSQRQGRETQKGRKKRQRSRPAAHGEALFAGGCSSRGTSRKEQSICSDSSPDQHPHQGQDSAPPEEGFLQALRRLSRPHWSKGAAARWSADHYLHWLWKADEAPL
jgi:hypothetical protein